MAITAEKKNDWILDSGGSSHMSYEKSKFVSVMDLKSVIKIKIANVTTVAAVINGSIPLSLNNSEHVTTYDALYVAKLD